MIAFLLLATALFNVYFVYTEGSAIAAMYAATCYACFVIEMHEKREHK